MTTHIHNESATPHPDLIVALDVPDGQTAAARLKELPERLTWFKIGLELFCKEGPAILETVKNGRRNIFLDLKLHDIPRTVERAVRSVCDLGVDLLTIHASGGEAMIRAAAETAAGIDGGPGILAVTMLTSLDEKDLSDIGVTRTAQDQVLALADLAQRSGAAGIVASPNEVAAIRKQTGPDFLIVTPGIRPAGSAVGDQKRVGTPAAAKKAGADYLVIGRPIMEADDPAAVVRAIDAELG